MTSVNYTLLTGQVQMQIKNSQHWLFSKNPMSGPEYADNAVHHGSTGLTSHSRNQM